MIPAIYFTSDVALLAWRYFVALTNYALLMGRNLARKEMANVVVVSQAEGEAAALRAEVERLSSAQVLLFSTSVLLLLGPLDTSWFP